MTKKFEKKSEKTEEEVIEPSRATQLFIVWRKLKRSKLALIGTGIVIFMVLVALLAPFISPYDPSYVDVYKRPPSLEHLFGTDNIGKDMLTLVMYGARISLYVAVVGVSIELLIGITIGMIAGFFGGIIDETLMRISDIVMSLPPLILLITAVSMFDVRGIHIIALIVGLLGWPMISRMVRSEFLSLRESTFVEAAKSMGASNLRIILHHILPNTLSVIIVVATIDIPTIIFYESTLSFLGFSDPSSPTWGLLLQSGYISLAQGHWWIITFPGLAILLTSLGFNLFGDGLRDALDVTTR